MAAANAILPIYFTQLNGPSSYVSDASLDAVCKIQTPNGQGTAFLLEFSINNEIRRGLFTCHHVACADKNSMAISPNLSDLIITFNKEKQPISLNWLARNNAQPITDAAMNFFFVDISEEFQGTLLKKGMNFLKQ